jgi:hypothetical protein
LMQEKLLFCIKTLQRSFPQKVLIYLKKQYFAIHVTYFIIHLSIKISICMNA